MFRSILIAMLLIAASSAHAAQTWKEGTITYRQQGNTIYNNSGQRVGDRATLVFPSTKRGHTCLAFADRFVCN
jgi:hypothetical protein